MHCIFFQNNQVLNLNPKTQAKKGLIIYINTIDGKSTLKNHVNVNQSIIFEIFEKTNSA
jgi:hypothetical protein